MVRDSARPRSSEATQKGSIRSDSSHAEISSSFVTGKQQSQSPRTSASGGRPNVSGANGWLTSRSYSEFSTEQTRGQSALAREQRSDEGKCFPLLENLRRRSVQPVSSQ